MYRSNADIKKDSAKARVSCSQPQTHDFQTIGFWLGRMVSKYGSKYSLLKFCPASAGIVAKGQENIKIIAKYITL